MRYDLRFPHNHGFVGLRNYGAVFGNALFWQDLTSTLIITVLSVIVELILGFLLAFVMHRALFGRAVVRASILVPYGIITVVAAFAWRFAFDPTTGFINGLLGTNRSWFTAELVLVSSSSSRRRSGRQRHSWRCSCSPGFTLVPQDVVNAARVDGASGCQRLRKIIIPLMKPAILVAVLFRTLDAFRIFDSVYVQTRGAENTETLSILGYNTLITRLNLGLGSAVSVVMFGLVLIIAFVFVKGFGTNLAQQRGEG